MKIQLYLLLFLSFVFSSNLLAVKTTGTLEKANIENLATTKKKPAKKFFKNMTQRVLENKIVKRLDKKFAKENAGRQVNAGLLSLIFSAVGLLTMLVASNPIIAITGLLVGLAGFIFGIIGVSKDEKKALSILGIVFGSIAVLAFLGLLVAILR